MCTVHTAVEGEGDLQKERWQTFWFQDRKRNRDQRDASQQLHPRKPSCQHLGEVTKGAIAVAAGSPGLELNRLDLEGMPSPGFTSLQKQISATPSAKALEVASKATVNAIIWLLHIWNANQFGRQAAEKKGIDKNKYESCLGFCFRSIMDILSTCSLQTSQSHWGFHPKEQISSPGLRCVWRGKANLNL